LRRGFCVGASICTGGNWDAAVGDAGWARAVSADERATQLIDSNTVVAILATGPSASALPILLARDARDERIPANDRTPDQQGSCVLTQHDARCAQAYRASLFTVKQIHQYWSQCILEYVQTIRSFTLVQFETTLHLLCNGSKQMMPSESQRCSLRKNARHDAGHFGVFE
jgi:hypothetical protein